MLPETGLLLVAGGMLPYIVKTDDELAAVLAYLIAKVLANHHMERKSWEYVANISPLFSETLSRIHEEEADYIALMLMADAGFDPAAAISVLKKMEETEVMIESAFPERKRSMTERAHVSRRCSYVADGP